MSVATCQAGKGAGGRSHFPRLGRGSGQAVKLGGMAISQSVSLALQQEGYRPQIGENGDMTFQYFGQSGTFRTRLVGSVILGKLECQLPRPEPEAASIQHFQESRPLCRLSGRGGQAVLSVETLLVEQEIGAQVRSLLQLLDQYSADFVWRAGEPRPLAGQHTEVAVPPPSVLPVEAQPPTAPFASVEEVQEPEPLEDSPTQVMACTATTVCDAPAGWEEAWSLLSARFHPLAAALARQGAPAPAEVQMDMLQGQQVRGTAIMLWGTPPEAVVVCEQGQPIPAGYQGATWYQHQTAEQVAAETLAYLKLARLV